MSNPTETALEAGLRAVRNMPDAPDAAGDDARVEAIAPTVAEAIADWCFGKGEKYWAKQIIAADPATSRIRALEERIDVLLGNKGIAVTAGMMLVEGIVEAEKKQQSLEEKNRALVEALEGLLVFYSEPGENSLEQFERIAGVFRRETGYLRPGKDSRTDDREVRQAAWDRWVEAKLSAARALVQS